MCRLGTFTAVALFLFPTLGLAQAPTAKQLELENKALVEVLRLQNEILSEPISFSAQATSSDKGKTTKEKFDEADKKARDGGYHREYHEAIRNNGGERLKEEFRKWCNNRPLNEKEINC